MTTPPLKRPRIRGTVILLILGGLYLLLTGIDALKIVNSPTSALLPSWFTPFVYLLIALGALQLIAAFLVATYKRSGLILTLVLVGIGLTATAWQIVGGTVALNLITIVNIVVNLAIVYYMYQYLTNEPEKSFFT